MTKRARLSFLFIFLLSMFAYNSMAEHPENTDDNTQHSDTHHEDGFKPGEFIFDHIGDSHEWHIITVKGHHVSVPLPIILYSKSSGISVFMSSKLAHGHHFKNFQYGEEEYKGEIIEINEHGEISVPLDFSITKNVFAIFISLALMLFLFFSISKSYKRAPCEAPKGLQNFLEPVILFIKDDVAIPSIGNKKYERFMPFLLTLFFFILINNLFGLIPIIPGGANVTGNIAVTLALALFTFFIQVFSGNKHFWKHIFNAPGVPWWLKIPIPLIPLIEFVGLLIKPFVLMVRLFANISAGHIIALGFFGLIFIFGQINVVAGYGISVLTVAFTIFMTCLELLVAFIQAYVFTLLSAIYFGMAVDNGH
ncbi:F0F1 ATP synthase subunit A [Bacteroidota bacterium]